MAVSATGVTISRAQLSGSNSKGGFAVRKARHGVVLDAVDGRGLARLVRCCIFKGRGQWLASGGEG